MRRLLVVRPEPGATATLEKARAKGLDAAAVPLFEVHALDWEAPEPSNFDAILLTSANAVRQAGEKLKKYRGLQAYAVGEATADAAREAGFGIASVGKAGVDRLLGSINPEMKLLHPCGEDRRSPDDPKQRITTVPVYRAAALPDPELGDLSGVVVLAHSPRAAARLAELVKDRSNTCVAAISDAAAEALGRGWARVEVADEPTDDALLALAARLCNTPKLV